MLYEYYGQTLNIPDEIFFKLSDKELDDYIASAHQMHIEDPFFDSVIEDMTFHNETEIKEEE